MGGAIYYNMIQPQKIKTNNYENNSAVYGPNVASYPFKMKVIDPEFKVSKWINEYASGHDIPNTIYVGLYDQDNQLIIVDSVSQCEIQWFDPELHVSGVTKVRAKNGVFEFNTLNIAAMPEFDTFIRFLTNGIDD